MYYLALVAAVILLALQFCMNKLYQSKNGSGVLTSLLFTALSGLCTALIFFVAGGFRLSATPFSLICAAGVALLCVGYNLLGFRIFSLGSFSVYMMFLMLGGMMLPFVYGLVFLGEASDASSLSLVSRLAGLVLLTVSLVLPCLGHRENGGNGKKSGGLFIVLCFFVFVMNGAVSVLSKIHTTSHVPFTEETFAGVSNLEFLVLTNLINGVLSLIALFAVMAVKKEKPVISGKTGIPSLVLIILGQAGSGGVSYFLQLIAAGHLPASVQYPILTGGSIVLTALAGRIFFREKQDGAALAGTFLAFAATFLFLI